MGIMPFSYVDRNNDGKITLDEWRGDRVTFDRADRYHDRALTRDEFLPAVNR